MGLLCVNEINNICCTSSLFFFVGLIYLLFFQKEEDTEALSAKKHVEDKPKVVSLFLHLS